MNIKFTDILLFLIIFVLVAYGIFFYLRQQRSKDIQNLQERKDQVLDIPVNDLLFTLKNMDLSGQTKRKFETFSANWQTINNFQFSDIEADLVTAEQYAEQLNLVKAKASLDQARTTLDETEEEVKALYDSLTLLLQVPEENEELHKDLLERYNEARKDILNKSHDYGPAIETLEKNLSVIELDFTKYNELTAKGDYLEGQDLLATLETSIDGLEETLDQIPKLYEKIKNDYEESVADLRDGYQRMLKTGFNFIKEDIPQEIDEIQELLDQAKSHIKSADLTEAKTLMDKSDRTINSLYDLMEAEDDARRYIRNHLPAVETELNQVMERNRYILNEVDRIAQNYILHSNELEKIQDLKQDLDDEVQRFMQVQEGQSAEGVVYTRLQMAFDKVKKQVQDISKAQENILTSISNLANQERQAKADLDQYELDLRNLKRLIEKSHLPGLDEDYYSQFYKVTDEIEYLSQRLNRVKIDMDEIHNLSAELDSNLAALTQKTEDMVDNAILTEYMIQHSNRFRYDYEEIDEAIQEAQRHFYDEYNYDEALAVIEKALRRVDSEGPTQVRRMYHYEKQNQMF